MGNLDSEITDSWKFSSIPPLLITKERDEVHRTFNLTEEQLELIAMDLCPKEESYYSQIINCCKNYLSIGYNYLTRNRNK